MAKVGSYSDCMMGVKHWEAQIGDEVRHPVFGRAQVKAVLNDAVVLILRKDGRIVRLFNNQFDEHGFARG